MKRYFTWLIILSIIAVSVSSLIVYNNDLACTSDGTHWIFQNCTARNSIFFAHQFTCMQCAATVRAVFVRDVKKVRGSDEYQNIDRKFTETNNSIRGDGYIR